VAALLVAGVGLGRRDDGSDPSLVA